jgi:hypothetical protein
MRLLRIVGGALVGLVVLALFAAWLAPRVLDWNRYRAGIASIAADTLGRPVQIAGPVSLTLLPRPVLVAARVTLPDTGDGSSADVAELRLQVGLGSLLTGRLEAEDLALYGARMRLPWPFRPGALQQHPPNWLSGLHARVEDGTLLVGAFTISDIAGTLSADPLTGTFSMDGLAAALGRRWRVTARLGRAGGDGSAPLEASLDGLGAVQDTGGTLSGQLAADGSLAGRVTARGRDLSQLIAGPAEPWHAAGRFRGGDGLALADDLDVEIGGVPARGAVALRLSPEARVDAALATSRLDLGAWLPNLLRGGGNTLPTSIDLSAEAATWGGGTLRHVRAAFDLARDGVSVRDAEAILPGDASLTLAGRYAAGRFIGAGLVTAPAFRETLRWLEPWAPALAAALPPDVLQAATLAGGVTIADGRLMVDGLTGTVDGSGISGALTLLPGARPALSGSLTLTGPKLDPWVPPLSPGLPAWGNALAGWPGRWDGLDLSLTVSAAQPRWRGAVLDDLGLDVVLQAGTLTVRRGVLTGPGFSANLAGSIAPGGHVADAKFDGTVARAPALAPLLPGVPGGLFQGQAEWHATAAGQPGALGVAVQTSVGDLRLDATGTVDLVRQRWNGSVDLRHPGAPRLLEMLDVPGVASWLGDGSFSLAASVVLDPMRAALSGFTLSAGMLRATGDLVLDQSGTPGLTGQVVAETLPLPLPYIRSPDPLPTTVLRGWRAQLGLQASHVLFGLSPGLDDAAAALSLADGVLRVTGLTGTVGGGRLTGQFELNAAATPRLSVQANLAGATVAGPLLDTALDLVSGRLNASAALQAGGFSPGALLATLDGTAQLSVTDGTLAGLDLPGVNAALALPDAAAVQAAVVKALQGGATDFSQLSADLAVQRGAVVMRQGAVVAPAGRIALSGTLDLPIDAADLLFAVTPARDGAPAIGLRLIGPVATPRRTPELAGLAGWLAGR